MKSDKELYRRLRALSAERLWNEEVPLFNRSTPKERMQRVAVIRAVGVAFSSSGSARRRSEVRAWLVGLLRDPNEKVRRYAMTALPKIGAGTREEGELLSLLRTTTVEREKKFLAQSLGKIGGRATLDAVGEISDSVPQTAQRIKANLARRESPSAIRMESVLSDLKGVRIHLSCRSGLEKILRDEVKEYIAKGGKLRMIEMRNGLVAIAPSTPFSLADIYKLRCFTGCGFLLGTVRRSNVNESIDTLAAMITSPLSRSILDAFTEGSIRYRLNFVSKGHQRGAVRLLVNRAYAMCPDILNDTRSAPWSVDIQQARGTISVELRPKLTPDPRFLYREHDIRIASHPPLAASMARLAGNMRNEIAWDPFCGSGVELIERVLLGGVQTVYGTDINPEAVSVSRANFAAANVEGVEAKFACCDFREWGTVEGLGPDMLTLMITNPPMGKRIRVPSLQGLFADLFAVAETVLKPGGRLVFPNPLRIESASPSLKLKYRQVIDLGGFDCRLEMYVKLPR